MNIIGIRREDKNEWERRVPLIPNHILNLSNDYNITAHVQPSELRIFKDKDYKSGNAIIKENLSEASVVLAVKEIPIELFQKDKTYIFFSHTIKGQDYNMDMLRRMMKLKCNLIDYERIVDDKHQRLIFFGKYAGLAGMIETLYAYGQKLKLRGYSTPLENVKQAYEYSSVEDAKEQLSELAGELRKQGLPKEIGPVVVGFAGYGNVSKGAQEIFDILLHKILTPEELKEQYDSLTSEDGVLYKVVFKEEHMVTPIEGDFELMEYFNHPERYKANFHTWLPYINVLVNCIYWTEDYPRLVTKEYLQNHLECPLSVIGDISCDIDGSVEITKKATYPDHPTFTYHSDKNRFTDETTADGITVMAVDNLPCEFPKESSTEFSNVLKDFIPEVVVADFNLSFDDLKLPPPIKKALILHRGKLTKDYQYMNEFLTQENQ